MPPKYYLPTLARNPLTRLRYRLLEHRRPLPDVPLHIQIETVAGCNASCVFCPNKKTQLQIPIGKKMDWDLYRKIVDEALDWGILRFSPYGNNEPMLDPELPERIKYIADRKKKGQFTKINSHGNLLTERMARRLLDSGLDRLNFSVQGVDPALYEKIMGLKLEKTLANIERFLELKRAGNYKRPRVRVCMLVTKYIEPQLPQIRQYWGARGIKINLNQIENRGDHQSLHNEQLAIHELKNFDWCNRMFEQLYIQWDGHLIQCCADWEQFSKMGDARTQTLRAVWNGPVYREYRERFLRGGVKGMLCDGCTKDAAGDEYADWEGWAAQLRKSGDRVLT